MTELQSLSVAVERQQKLFTTPEELALAGFLSGCSGLTLDAYRLDLRQFVAWCTEREVRLFGARRVDIEQFGRHLEALGRARATVTRRFGTIVCFFRYAEEEGLIERSPAVHVRRPRLDYESHATGLDRNEVGALLVAAGLSGPRDHALLSLLTLNGLRVSEATGADIERLGLERGHRTLTVLRKGGKTVLIPLAPRTARAIDLAVGERTDGPIFLGNDDQRLDRHAAGAVRVNRGCLARQTLPRNGWRAEKRLARSARRSRSELPAARSYRDVSDGASSPVDAGSVAGGSVVSACGSGRERGTEPYCGHDRCCSSASPGRAESVDPR